MTTLAEPAVRVGSGAVSACRQVVGGIGAVRIAHADQVLACRQIVGGIGAVRIAHEEQIVACRQIAGGVGAVRIVRDAAVGAVRRVDLASRVVGTPVADVMRRAVVRVSWPIVGLPVSPVVKGGAVRAAAMVSSVTVGQPSACGRFDRLLEGWSALPAPWEDVAVPAVGYVGRSLAALAVLRGAEVVWSSSDGRVSVGGLVLIADSGQPALAASAAAADAEVVRACKALVVAIGISAGYAGEERRRQQEASRAAHRRIVAKVARWVGDQSLSVGQSRALQAELRFREARL